MTLHGRRKVASDDWRFRKWYAETKRVSDVHADEFYRGVDEIRRQRLGLAAPTLSQPRLIRAVIEERGSRARGET